MPPILQQNMNYVRDQAGLASHQTRGILITRHSLTQIAAKQVMSGMIMLCLTSGSQQDKGIGSLQVRSAARMAVKLSASKKFLNDPKDAVTESLEGLVAATPHLQRLDGFPGVIAACMRNAALHTSMVCLCLMSSGH